jgi:hypothetical protein
LNEDVSAHTVELNKFADMTDEEYISLLKFKPDLTKP